MQQCNASPLTLTSNESSARSKCLVTSRARDPEILPGPGSPYFLAFQKVYFLVALRIIMASMSAGNNKKKDLDFCNRCRVNEPAPDGPGMGTAGPSYSYQRQERENWSKFLVCVCHQAGREIGMCIIISRKALKDLLGVMLTRIFQTTRHSSRWT